MEYTTWRGGEEPPTKIKIVDARAVLVRLATVKPAELAARLRDAANALKPGGRLKPKDLANLPELVERYQAVRGITAAGESGTMEEVRTRQLLSFTAVTPKIVWPRPPATNAAISTALRVRAPRRLKVLTGQGDAAVAAEEPMQITSLATRQRSAGGQILELYGGQRLAQTRWRFNDIDPVAPVLRATLAARKLRGRLVVERELQITSAAVDQLRAEASLAASFLLGGDLPTRRRAPQRGARQQLHRSSPVAMVEWRDRAAAVELLRKLAKVLPSIAPPNKRERRATLIADLLRAGALSMFRDVQARRGSADDPEILRFLDAAAMQVRGAQRSHELERLAFEALARARTLMSIVASRLSTRRHAAVVEKLRTFGAGAEDSPQSVLAALTKQEKSIVEATYANRLHEWKANADNKCKHVQLAFRLRRAATAQESLQTLKKLSAYFAPGAEAGGWHMCRNCEFRALCPHVADLVRMRAAGTPYATIRDRLAKYQAKYTEPGATSFSYFCRICSERLSRADPPSRRTGPPSLIGDDGLRRALWGEAMRAAGNIRFPELVDPKRIAVEVTAACLPLLRIFEEGRTPATRRRAAARAAAKHSGRRKPESDELFADEEVGPRTRLDAALLVAAFALNLVRSSPDVGYEGVRPGSRINDYAREILATVMRTRSLLIAKIGDVSPEYIADRYRQAYKLVVARSQRQVLTVEDREAAFVQDLVETDPIYRFAVMAAKVAGALPVKLPSDPAKRLRAARREFETAFGKSPAAAGTLSPSELKSKTVREALALDAKGRTKSPRIAKYPPGRSPTLVRKSPGVNLFDSLFNPARRSNGGEFVEAYSLLRMYVADAYTPDKVAKFEAVAAAAAVRATKRNRARHVAMLNPGVSLISGRDSRQFGMWANPAGLRPCATLADVFGEAGHRHSWIVSGGSRPYPGTFIYVRGKTRRELTPKQVMSARTDPSRPLHGFRVADVRCSRCKVLRSKTGDLDLAVVAESAASLANFVSFFSFFRSRCPAGGIHDMAPDVCKKCGITAALLADHSGPKARKYFDKYAAVFRQNRADALSAAMETAPSESPASEIAARKAAAAEAKRGKKTADAYRFDFDAVVRAAASANITPQVLMSIGATEGRKFSDVVAGVNPPPPPSTFDDVRIMAADAAVLELISSYNQLRFAARFIRPRADVEALIAAAKVPPSEIASLATRFPDPGNFAATRRAFVADRTPADLLNYMIETVALVINRAVSVDGPKWVADLGRRFAVAAGGRIARREKLFAHHGPFSFKIFGDRGEGDGAPGSDMIGIDAQDEIVPDETDDGVFDGFSLEGTDLSAAAVDANLS